MSHKYVYLFSEGNGSMRELLGGKGANLAEMTVLGTVSYTHLNAVCRSEERTIFSVRVTLPFNGLLSRPSAV